MRGVASALHEDDVGAAQAAGGHEVKGTIPHHQLASAAGGYVKLRRGLNGRCLALCRQCRRVAWAPSHGNPAACVGVVVSLRIGLVRELCGIAAR